MALQLTRYEAIGPCRWCGCEVKRVRMSAGTGWGPALSTTAMGPPRPCIKRGDRQSHELTVVPTVDNNELEEWLDAD